MVETGRWIRAGFLCLGGRDGARGRHSVRLENKERSATIFLRYGIQSILIRLAQNRQKQRRWTPA